MKKILALLLMLVMISAMNIVPAVGQVYEPTLAFTDIIPDGIGRYDFNENWKFFLATRNPVIAGGTNAAAFAANGFADTADLSTADAIRPDFDDSGWRTVKVPHDFMIEGARVTAAEGGVMQQGWFQSGLAWYRKSFVIPESFKGVNRVALDFDGVYENSVVYVNGQLVGNYPSGYTGFTYDITSFLNYGEDNPNIVAVKVQNLASSGRWYTGGGITQPVSMVVTGQTRFQRNGVTISAPEFETVYKADGSADVKLSAKVYSNDSNGNAYLDTKVFDADGNQVLTHRSPAFASSPPTSIELSDEFVIPAVKLWSMEDPYRYTFEINLQFDKGGGNLTIVDSFTQKFGFRWFKIDNDKGAFLNDEYVKFYGVNIHHDEGALGAASTYDAIKRKLLIMMDMGVNTLRTAHNPVPKATIELCSELGLLCLEEAYDGWGTAKATYDFGIFFLRAIPENWAGSLLPIPTNTLWSDWVIKEMVSRDINEPSIVIWSIGNENRGNGTRPSWYNWRTYLRPGDPEPSNYTATTFNEYTEALRLRNDVLDVDDTRYITYSGDQLRDPAASSTAYNSTWGYVAQALDGFGLNYNTAGSLDTLHDRFPETFFFESESSCQTGVRGVYYTPNLGNTLASVTPGDIMLSSAGNAGAAHCMPNEYCLKRDRDREFFVGGYLWAGCDYLGEPSPLNTGSGVYPWCMSVKGRVDTAGFKKDNYYQNRAQWRTDDNTTHIFPMNWTDWNIGEEIEVQVSTNAYQAELFLNGESLGIKHFDKKVTTFGLEYYETTERTNDSGGTSYQGNNTSSVNTGGYVSPNGSYGKLHLTWYVPYEPGELKAVTMDEEGNVVGQDIVRTAGSAYTLNITPDRTVVKADGNSLIFFEVDVVDKNGVMLPSANNLVRFDVDGGMIIGVDNGRPDSTELYKWNNIDRSPHSEREALNGKVLCIVESDKEVGEIVLRATSDYLVGVTVKALKTVDGTGAYSSVCVPDELGAPVNATLKEGEITVATGKAPTLPAVAEVTYANGAKTLEKIVWDAVDPTVFLNAGIVTVAGTAHGLPVSAAITVSGAISRENIALNPTVSPTSYRLTDTSGPLATASYTAYTTVSSNISPYYPNNMLNGNTTNNWSNRVPGSIPATQVVAANANHTRPFDWVSVYWKGGKEISELALYFTTGGSGPSNNLPARLNVQYWDGIEWVDAANQEVVFATASNEATTLTFNPVVTDKVRVCMWNATPFTTSGGITITKFEVYSKASRDLNTPVFTDADYNWLTSLSSDTLITILTYQNETDQVKDLSMIVAVYSPAGRLAYIKADAAQIDPGATNNFAARLDMPENNDGSYADEGYYAIVYLWDSVTFVPIKEQFVF